MLAISHFVWAAWDWAAWDIVMQARYPMLYDPTWHMQPHTGNIGPAHVCSRGRGAARITVVLAEVCGDDAGRGFVSLPGSAIDRHVWLASAGSSLRRLSRQPKPGRTVRRTRHNPRTIFSVLDCLALYMAVSARRSTLS
jgi:hypothetical protein